MTLILIPWPWYSIFDVHSRKMYLHTKNNVYRPRYSNVTARTEFTDMLFCFCDLVLGLMTLIYESRLDIPKMYVHIKMKFLDKGFQMLELEQSQTDTQADATGRINMRHSRVIIRHEVRISNYSSCASIKYFQFHWGAHISNVMWLMSATEITATVLTVADNSTTRGQSVN